MTSKVSEWLGSAITEPEGCEPQLKCLGEIDPWPAAAMGAKGNGSRYFPRRNGLSARSSLQSTNFSASNRSNSLIEPRSASGADLSQAVSTIHLHLQKH